MSKVEELKAIAERISTLAHNAQPSPEQREASSLLRRGLTACWRPRSGIRTILRARSAALIVLYRCGLLVV